jgi:hypothetical protein
MDKVEQKGDMKIYVDVELTGAHSVCNHCATVMEPETTMANTPDSLGCDRPVTSEFFEGR